MNYESINRLQVLHKAAGKYLDLLEIEQDANKKNILTDWYESTVNEINEMRVPNTEKREYFNLDYYEHGTDIKVDRDGIHFTEENE